ncbi:Aste57867_13944 [Aphanomyces stellatus]|uniref:Aste57867_13944 protein n=1 Tax=Aphanomyces stellatus TaxID=120398 RepID=A0A485L007_9STRA|nr:hypothetical protein As57867_013893 [Aphanomyces stellatus]VFT90774.1 Aste57867_13944 [Aphanomyces stellatus]
MTFKLPRQLLALWVLCSVPAGLAASVCADPRFTTQPAVPLGPMSIRSLVGNSTVCIQVLFSSLSASYVAIAIAQTPYMVNSPATNAVVFDTTSASTFLAIIQDYDEHSVPRQLHQSGLTPVNGGISNGQISFTFERPLADTTAYDVTIDSSAASYVQWAYSDREWPSQHLDYGATKILLGAPTTAAALADDGIQTSTTPEIAALALALIVLLGLGGTYVAKCLCLTKFLYHKSVCAPTKRLEPWCLQPWANFKLGEVVVALVYVGCLAVVTAQVNTKFVTLAFNHRLPLISGHLSLVALVFLLLPVARGKHWELIFGASYERILKFHRWLGRLCFLTGTIHLVVVLVNNTDVTSTIPYGPQQVVPLFGLLAFIAFGSMALVSIDSIRRMFYSYFILHHRIAAVVGIVFVLLHSRTACYAMILPLAVYGLTLLARLVAVFANTTTVSAKPSISSKKSTDSRSVLLTLPATTKSTKLAQDANPCSFFWVNIPRVSLIEWHPFSAIVTPDGNSIAFCIKAMGANRFTDKVFRAAYASANAGKLTIRLDGPHGKPSLDDDDYDVLVLVAGGIGITPLLGLVNRHRVQPNDRPVEIHLHWVVRSPHDLLMVESLMFPLPATVKATFYVTQAKEGGCVLCQTGDGVAYVGGRPVLQDVLHPERYAKKRVGVLACGPPTLVQDAEWLSHACGFDFHKEVFSF